MKKNSNWSLFGNVSGAPLKVIQDELERLEVENPILLASVEIARLSDTESLADKLDVSGVDTDIEDAMALEISRRLLRHDRDSRSLNEASRLIQVLVHVIKLRETFQSNIADEVRAYEEEVIASGDFFIHPPIDSVDDLENITKSRNEIDAQRALIKGTTPTGPILPSESVLLSLIREEEHLEPSKSEAPLRSIIRNFWSKVNLPTYDTKMDAKWISLSPRIQDQIIDDLRRTVIFWEIAKPALLDSSRPGVLPALMWGLQLPLENGRDKSLSKSALDKTIKNLRGAWMQILLFDPDALLWAAREIALDCSDRLALEGILGLAGHKNWNGKKGRKNLESPKVAKVKDWYCPVCSTSFVPGDVSHDSPQSAVLLEAIDPDSSKFETYGRVVRGLPDFAYRWNRLMCNARWDGKPCWWRGGVLEPNFHTLEQ